MKTLTVEVFNKLSTVLKKIQSLGTLLGLVIIIAFGYTMG